MPMQMRSTGGLGYAPDRDLAHALPGIVSSALRNLEACAGNDLIGNFLQEAGVSDEELGAVAVAVAKYIEGTVEPETKGVLELLESSGFLATAPKAQLGMLALIGQTVLYLYFHQARFAYAIDEPQYGLEKLLDTAAKVKLHFVAPKSQPKEATSEP